MNINELLLLLRLEWSIEENGKNPWVDLINDVTYLFKDATLLPFKQLQQKYDPPSSHLFWYNTLDIDISDKTPD